MIDGSYQPTQAEFGALVGIGQPAVAKLVERKILQPGGTLGAWLHAYCSNLRKRAGGQSAGLLAERERLSRARAIGAELANAKLRGELVDAEGVFRAVVSLTATARSGFERIPDKLADRLAALGDPHECHALLVGEIDQVLADLAAGAGRLNRSLCDAAPKIGRKSDVGEGGAD